MVIIVCNSGNWSDPGRKKKPSPTIKCRCGFLGYFFFRQQASYNEFFVNVQIFFDKIISTVTLTRKRMVCLIGKYLQTSFVVAQYRIFSTIVLSTESNDVGVLTDCSAYPFIRASSGNHMRSGFITTSSRPSKSLVFHISRLSYQSCTKLKQIMT